MTWHRHNTLLSQQNQLELRLASRSECEDQDVLECLVTERTVLLDKGDQPGQGWGGTLTERTFLTGWKPM